MNILRLVECTVYSNFDLSKLTHIFHIPGPICIDEHIGLLTP